jgi:hypothetical protein
MPENQAPPSREEIEKMLAEKLTVSLNQIMRMCLLVG